MDIDDQNKVEQEYLISENIDEYSEKITSREFNARVTLEGVFKGITRIVGNDLNKFFEELIKSAEGKCMYYRISLRRRTGQWDEVVIVMCGKTIVGAYGSFLNEKIVGKKALSELIDLLKKGTYKVGIIEQIELNKELISRFTGYVPSEISGKTKPREEKIKTMKIDDLNREMGLEETLQLERIEYSSTQPVNASEARSILPERILSIYGVKRLIDTKAEEKHPISIEDALKYDRLVFKFNECISDYMDQHGIIISKMEIDGDDRNLNVTAYITKLKKASKEDLFRYANDIANILTDTINDEGIEIERITVTIKHGLYTIKVSKAIQ